MKTVAERFKDYYPITNEEKSRVFNDDNTYFVFDTNALLDIFRVGQSLSSKIMKIFKKYGNRIIIPYHVAEEYHDNLIPVIVGFSNKYENIAKNLTLDALLKGVIKDFELDKYPFIQDALKRNFGDGLKKFGSEMRKEHKYLQEQISSWTLQNDIASFLDDKILDGFTKEEIDAIEKEGADRYKNHIPPGHEDKDKKTNIYGDLIIWKEILKFAEEHQNSSIVFISRDLKEDWITHVHGKKWGPRVELLMEFHEKNHNTLLMYTLSEFIKYANTGSRILNAKDIQSVVDYTSAPDSRNDEIARQAEIAGVNWQGIMSNQDIQNLLLLSLLRRNMRNTEEPSVTQTQQTEETNSDKQENEHE